LEFKKTVPPFDFIPVRDGEQLQLGGVDWTVIATPGHSPGGVCYYNETGKLLLSGDTLFAGAIGRGDLMGGDYDVLIRSILEKVMTLPGDTDLFPGHGPASSIARESAVNPFLLPFNEPYSEE
ncbi:MAG: MBL fold metallo-hydrolase, partial [Bacteroidales bacterium]|nr:MBL fold metallo-hydrolase [Bacteroidales bacterium]